MDNNSLVQTGCLNFAINTITSEQNLLTGFQSTIIDHFVRWLVGGKQATSHILNQCWPCLLTHICVIRPRIRRFYKHFYKQLTPYASATVLSFALTIIVSYTGGAACHGRWKLQSTPLWCLCNTSKLSLVQTRSLVSSKDVFSPQTMNEFIRASKFHVIMIPQ